MIDFYRKVNKFFKKFAKCDPCKRTSELITLFEPRPNNKTQKHHWTNAILEHTSIHHQRLPCGTKFLRVLIFAIFPAIRANKFPRIKIIVKKFFYAQFLACNHVTRRSCWWRVVVNCGHQYNIIFCRRIYMKIRFSSQRREMLLLLILTHHQHGSRDVACKPAIKTISIMNAR